ncbi:hypothetical protein FRC17_004541 [Serendipita sp. 399]|nr:hypothetical protein FRC17_004541 [Serendipita sp. 399]
MDAMRLSDAESLGKVRVLRLYKSVRGPLQLLQECVNLEALWVLYHRIYTYSGDEGSSVLSNLRNLSYLHIAAVAIDVGKTIALHFPALTYLSVDFSFYRSSTTPPLDIHAPNVRTLVLSGWIYGEHAPVLARIVHSCKDSIVNLVLLCKSRGGLLFLPLDHLSEFPCLSTLGLGIESITSVVDSYIVGASQPNPSPLSLALFGLENCVDQRRLGDNQQALSRIFTTDQNPFSRITLSVQWGELRDTWGVHPKNVDFTEMRGALPSYWYLLEHLDKNGALIQDQTGTGLWEGEARILAERMKAYSKRSNEIPDDTHTKGATAAKPLKRARPSKFGRLSRYICSLKRKIQAFVTR